MQALAAILGITLLVHGQAATASRPAALPGTAEGGWRESRGDPLNTGVSHGGAPSFSGVRWKFLADSEILNSPAVMDGAVYFGSLGGMRELGGGRKVPAPGHLYAVRAKDGSKIWEKPLSVSAGDGSFWGFTFSSPLLFGGRVYIGSEDGNLYCVSQATGDLVFKRPLGGSGDSARIWSSPKTDGRLIFIGSHTGFMYGIDPERGDVKWKTWIGDQIGGTAGILGSELFIPGKDRRLHVLDAATGVERWRVDLEGWSMGAPVLALGCAVLRATGGRGLCVDLVSRSILWTAALPSSTHAVTSMAWDGSAFYVNASASVFALSGGDVLWETKIGVVDSSPVVAGDFVIAGGNEGVLRALDRKTGAKVREITLSERITGTPTIVGGVAYVPGASGTLFAVE